jgi:hypothetical protein
MEVQPLEYMMLLGDLYQHITFVRGETTIFTES